MVKTSISKPTQVTSKYEIIISFVFNTTQSFPLLGIISTTTVETNDIKTNTNSAGVVIFLTLLFFRHITM
jgi:hypothetical protein